MFGVYVKSGSATIDFATNAPDNAVGSHESNREDNLTNGALNLLREDSDTFPLYILQGGGAEITRSDETEAHTYVITEHAIDTSKIPNFTSFEDYDWVVECTVFGFGLGFINQNNFVLPRATKPNGTATDSEIENLRMCIPSAIPQRDEVYIAGSRTVYQGDPFYTIGVLRLATQTILTDTEVSLGRTVIYLEMTEVNSRLTVQVLLKLEIGDRYKS